MPESTAIVLTPPGAAAIAVMRLSGPRILDFLAVHFSKKGKPGRCVHGNLHDAQNVIDDPVVVLSEDQTHVDLNLHGGPWVIQSTLELARRFGFSVLETGELPLREQAVDGHDSIGREMLAHLPLATTELGLRELLRQPEAWRRFETLDRGDRRDAAEKMLNDRGLWSLLHPPRVALVGAANVGKSTLANQLFGQERSITADLPGTTRDWVGEAANLDGLPVWLVDTPGIRQTTDPIEHLAIERAAETVRAADLVILILDVTRPLDPDQTPLIARFSDSLKVCNKCDLPTVWDDTELGAIRIVATTASGVDTLRKAIHQKFGVSTSVNENSSRWWTVSQQQRLQEMAG